MLTANSLKESHSKAIMAGQWAPTRTGACSPAGGVVSPPMRVAVLPYSERPVQSLAVAQAVFISCGRGAYLTRQISLVSGRRTCSDGLRSSAGPAVR